MTSREAAAAVVLAVGRGEYADLALRAALRDGRLTGAAAARATALAFGTVRLRNRCDGLLSGLIDRPLPDLDPVLLAVLRVGLFELVFARHSEPAPAVHDLVDIARRRGHAGLSRFANAVLRRVSREADRLAQPPAGLSELARLVQWESHPRWLAQRWLQRYGFDTALSVCRAGNREPDVTLRVNSLRVDRDRVLQALADEGVEAVPGKLAPEAIHVRGGGRVDALPGFAGGWFSIQDEAAMLVAPVTGVQPGWRVLDLCAAPGGKAAHLAELMAGEGTVLAADINAARLKHVAESYERLGLTNLETLAQDARTLAGEVAPADVVLLDAPCSGTATLARRADLRWNVSVERQRELVALQRELLQTAARLVKPGGVLVYATCTLEPEENEEQMRWLATEAPRLVPDSDGGRLPPGWQAETAWATVLPSADGDHDGCFVARRRHRGA